MANIKDLTIVIKKNLAALSKDIYHYVGDSGTTFLILVLESRGNLMSSNVDVVENFGANHACVRIVNQENEIVLNKECQIYDTKVGLEFNSDDEISEAGEYLLQIHLYDENNNRLTIPPVPITIIKPL